VNGLKIKYQLQIFAKLEIHRFCDICNYLQAWTKFTGSLSVSLHADAQQVG